MVVIIKFKFFTEVFLEVACNNIEYNIMLNILIKMVLVEKFQNYNKLLCFDSGTKQFFHYVYPKMEHKSTFTGLNL